MALFSKEKMVQKNQSVGSYNMKSKPAGNKTGIIPIKQLIVKVLFMFV
jgi:hypothetical protein